MTTQFKEVSAAEWKDIAARLKEEATRVRETHNEFLRATKIPESTFYAYLRGGVIPPYAAYAMQGAGVDVVYLLTGKRSKTTFTPHEILTYMREHGFMPASKGRSIRVNLSDEEACIADDMVEMYRMTHQSDSLPFLTMIVPKAMEAFLSELTDKHQE